MKNEHPLVSIVIPVYNGSNYMREAIDSAISQTYSNIEILVVNDGSTDDGLTHDIALSYGEKIRYFKKENGGVVSALNYGIENMCGDYFAWLSHDDIYMPEKIEKQVLALKKHKGSRPAFCVCNCTFIDENGAEMYNSYVSKDCAFDDARCFLFLGNVGFNGIMVLIPKELFDVCGMFTPSLATHEYDMWIRIMDVADIVVEPKCLTYMRMHPHQVSSQKKQDAAKEIDQFIGEGIQSIPPPVFESFVTNQVDEKGIDYILGLLNGYMWYQDLPFTATQTLKQLALMCEKPNTHIDNIYTKLLGHAYIEELKSCIARRQHSKSKLITIYCENLTDDVYRGIAAEFAFLSTQCEIVLFYQSGDGDDVRFLRDINITPIPVLYNYDRSMPLRMALLCYLLNTKVYWNYNTNSDIGFSQVFHYLKVMQIPSIASFYDLEQTILFTRNNCNISYSELKKSISKASLITCCTFSSASGSLSFRNMIMIPNRYLQALMWWKRIFDVLLYVEDYNGLDSIIENNLSPIIEEYHSSSDYIDYISSFLLEVDRKSMVLIYEYEQRTFWKLTKPVRSCVRFFRKLTGAIKHIITRRTSIRSVFYRLKIALMNRRFSV